MRSTLYVRTRDAPLLENFGAVRDKYERKEKADRYEFGEYENERSYFKFEKYSWLALQAEERALDGSSSVHANIW